MIFPRLSINPQAVPKGAGKSGFMPDVCWRPHAVTSNARMTANATGRRRCIHRQKSCKLRTSVQAMRNRSAALLLFLFVLAASSCSRTPKRAFPLVQKYTTQAGDLFYFRPRDGQFVLLERRKALAVAGAAEPEIETHSSSGQNTGGGGLKIRVLRPPPRPRPSGPRQKRNRNAKHNP